VQLASPSKAINAATFLAPDGRPCVLVQDLSLYLNSMMFTCLSQHGLGEVLHDLIGFEGAAMRLRKATEFGEGSGLVGKTIGEAAFAWEDGIAIGVIGPRYMSTDVIDSFEGIAPSVGRTIHEDDHIIFVSARAVPRTALRVPSLLTDAARTTPKKVPDDRAPLAVLVCGWRVEWDDPKRFALRVRETAGDLPAQSHLTFFCMKACDAFVAFMARVKQADKQIIGDPGNWSFRGRVTISQNCGDAANYALLEDVINERAYTHAIVMSTMANKTLSPESRDVRMMSIMLMLRHFQEELGKPPMSVIGENALDATSLLALAPQGQSGRSDTDYINVQAIYARALCVSVAYPTMAPAIAQLFSKAPRMPNIVLDEAIDIVPSGRSVAFVEMQQRTKTIAPDDICIGFRTVYGSFILVPGLWEEHQFEKGDKLIILSRRSKAGTSEDLRCAGEPGSEARDLPKELS